MAVAVATRSLEPFLGSQDVDPLALSIAPSSTETPAEREARIAREAHAKKVSDEIDHNIEKERERERRSTRSIKVLLLGQSESGKSTTLKNFQLVHDSRVFRSQKPSWRAVIQLNIVRSIRIILEAIGRAQRHEPNTPSSSPISTVSRRFSDAKTGNIDLYGDILDLKTRLEPLIELERSIIARLTAAGNSSVDPQHAAQLLGPGPNEDTPLSSTTRQLRISTSAMTRKHTPGEVAVISALPWKDAFNKLLKSSDDRTSFDSRDLIDFDDPEDPGHVLSACSQDMVQLWSNQTVRQMLEKQKVQLDLSSGFFLDELERVTAQRYVPTDDDILKARLKTLGVSEHKLVLKDVFGTTREWIIYDVGGHRSQRGSTAAWVPFFEDVDAIIFLAPISCFDEMLEEDHKTNRLEDSFRLWTMIVTNKLLRNSNLILFLNKLDILHKKLERGVYLKDHVISFGDRPNDVSSVVGYLKRKFFGILQEKSPSPRAFYHHLTTVIDSSSTKKVISDVRETLMRQHLSKVNLIK